MDDCPEYRAERLLKLPCWREVVYHPQSWIDHVTSEETFIRARRAAGLPAVYVSVAPSPTRTRAVAFVKLGHIETPTGPVTQQTLLHEVAHLCLPASEAHSRRFCATLLALTRRWLSNAAAAELLSAYREHDLL